MKILFFLLALQSISVHAGPRIVGNGGDLIESADPSLNNIFNAIFDSRKYIEVWMNKQDVSHNESLKRNLLLLKELPLGINKILANKRKFQDILENVLILNHLDSPCPSADGPRDASVVPRSNPTICISIKNLKSKLNENNIKVQVEALILHELSHFLGTSEAEAVEIQKAYLNQMKNVSSSVFLHEAELATDRLKELAYSNHSYHTKHLLEFPKSEFFQFFSYEDHERIENKNLNKTDIDLLLYKLTELKQSIFANTVPCSLIGNRISFSVCVI